MYSQINRQFYFIRMPNNISKILKSHKKIWNNFYLINKSSRKPKKIKNINN